MKTPIFFSFALIFLLSTTLAGCGASPTASVAATPTPVSQAVGSQDQEGEVVVEGNIVPRDFTRILTRAGGKIAEVLVKKGDRVQKDAVLVRFDGREQVQAALATAKLEQLTAQQALDLLNEKVDVAQAHAQVVLVKAQRTLDDAKQHRLNLDYRFTAGQVAAANAGYILAQNEVDRLQGYYDTVAGRPEDDAVRALATANLENAKKARDKALANVNWYKGKADPQDIAEADADIVDAEAKLADARRELDKTKNGPNADDLALAQSRLENAKAQVSAAQKSLDDLEIKAPFAGVVVEMDLVAGDILPPNQQVALVADLDELYVETNDLTEMNVVKVKEGSAAQIRPDALPGLTLPAKITEIAQISGKKGGDVTYVVRLKLDQSDPRLRWGMTVEVRFK